MSSLRLWRSFASAATGMHMIAIAGEAPSASGPAASAALWPSTTQYHSACCSIARSSQRAKSRSRPRLLLFSFFSFLRGTSLALRSPPTPASSLQHGAVWSSRSKLKDCAPPSAFSRAHAMSSNSARTRLVASSNGSPAARCTSRSAALSPSAISSLIFAASLACAAALSVLITLDVATACVPSPSALAKATVSPSAAPLPLASRLLVLAPTSSAAPARTTVPTSTWPATASASAAVFMSSAPPHSPRMSSLVVW
mmetsp:Transcript_8290/g.33554  ORF Transcript_8290/g.33554 Transcript_8290/m.33554 type:complete len:255 (-) Transcript_8290:529-1293(-)